MTIKTTKHGTFIKNLFADIETVPQALQASYYPSLNGIRGIAVIMVLVSHLQFTSGNYYDAVFNGHLGVIMFFVLSGFLITSLCIKEKVITKTISLKSFYIRRCLRILPVAWLYIVVVLILNVFFKLNINYISLLGAAFFLMDISSYFRRYHFSWFTAHYWSLAVEEQFYLVFPFLIKNHFKLYLSLILFIVFILPLIICVQSIYPAINTGIMYAFTHLLVKFQAIAVGCLFSIFFLNISL